MTTPWSWSPFALRQATSGHARHPADSMLMDLLVPGSEVPTAADAAVRAHVSQCEPCAERVAALKAFLDGVSETAQADVDREMTRERLATQHARIIGRLRRSVEPRRPARVLRFPPIARPALARVHRASRWLSAAAAAGLIVGVTAGQFLHVHPGTDSQNAGPDASVSQDVAQAPPASSVMASASLAGDPVFIDDTTLFGDAFLDEVDLMLVAPRIPELDPLDEITPRIREVSVRPW